MEGAHGSHSASRRDSEWNPRLSGGQGNRGDEAAPAGEGWFRYPHPLVPYYKNLSGLTVQPKYIKDLSDTRIFAREFLT